jgi:hypothetical protein
MNQLVTLKSGGRPLAIVPTSIEDVFRIAKAVSMSGLAPKGMSTPEQITVAIMHGAELGLPPMQAIQRIAVVNGRPTLWGDAVPALLWAAGFKIREWESETVCHCEVTRPDGTKIERTFSDADAKKAGLLGKAGPWTQYPARMKAMRARGFAARDGASDVLGGLYIKEELDDIEPVKKSAHKARKDGDFERLTAGLRAVADTDALDTFLVDNKEAIEALPNSWLEHLNEHIDTARKRLAPDDPISDANGCLAMIQQRRNDCESAEEVEALKADVADLIARLSPADQAKAQAIMEDAE